MCKTQNARYHARRDTISLLCKDFAVEIQESRFNDGGNCAWVNFAEGMILAHVSGDAAGVEGETGCTLVTVHQAGSEAIGAVDVVSVQRRGNLEACGLIINVVA